MIKITGTAGAQISTPDGMVTLNRNGEAFIRLKSTVEFLTERIEAGGLAGFELEETVSELNTGDTGNVEGVPADTGTANSKKKTKGEPSA